jgi:hypothetical protein
LFNGTVGVGISGQRVSRFSIGGAHSARKLCYVPVWWPKISAAVQQVSLFLSKEYKRIIYFIL